ncbi:hypothetical protein [Microbacterium sp. Clip185]|uniref:hypothetical protein n=1 Tax=Microbacterium sp. Clip185 TaxID=3025663 RepID=UPI002366A4AC|nr:hypothetical protein [Microbacterium sp. Clip185]WDG17255.1 hypothetical protein PQV94_11540 [Microbacterium sp. Clip185]
MLQRTYPPNDVISARVPGADDLVLVDDDRLLVVVSIRAFPEGIEARLMVCSAPGIDLRDSLMRNPNAALDPLGARLELVRSDGHELFSILRGGGSEHACDLILYAPVAPSAAVHGIVFTWHELDVDSEHLFDIRVVADARARAHAPRWI